MSVSLEKVTYTIPCEYSYGGSSYGVNVVLDIPFAGQGSIPTPIPVSNADSFDTLADSVLSFLGENGFTSLPAHFYKEVMTVDQIT